MGKVQKSLKLHFVSLGCAKNLVDSERALSEALRALEATVVDSAKGADLVVVNTCAFIREAVEESVETVLRARREAGPEAKLAVIGCFPARYPQKLGPLLPEADLILPRRDLAQFAPQIAALFGRAPVEAPPSFENVPRARATPPFRAYLKIAEGCNRKCSFCLIPQLRGKLVARPLDELLREAASLVAQGALELTLIAQDATAWRDGNARLADLARALASLTGLRWIRLLYAYPDRVDARLVAALKEIPQVVPYLDAPFQHASPKIVAAMGRVFRDPLKRIRAWRKAWPEIAIRSTLMVGFPGETDADFDLLMDFLRRARFASAGFFAFSREKGTGAYLLPERVPPKVKRRRLALLAAAQKKISREINRARVGQEIEVLVEGPSAESPLIQTGRAPFQAPDVDGLVYFDGDQPPTGKIVRARVLEARAYDLLAAWTDGERLS
ncbi:MAG: 30S ribosomal protein S12 methylthiotransferase RimO [Deltaproteobacteria bacterium]|nr:30S ribosomal protein S12 methylthiotransferase RimO [Deltaproteobacteria bacterium]